MGFRVRVRVKVGIRHSVWMVKFRVRGLQMYYVDEFPQEVETCAWIEVLSGWITLSSVECPVILMSSLSPWLRVTLMWNYGPVAKSCVLMCAGGSDYAHLHRNVRWSLISLGRYPTWLLSVCSARPSWPETLHSCLAQVTYPCLFVPFNWQAPVCRNRLPSVQFARFKGLFAFVW